MESGAVTQRTGRDATTGFTSSARIILENAGQGKRSLSWHLLGLYRGPTEGSLHSDRWTVPLFHCATKPSPEEA